MRSGPINRHPALRLAPDYIETRLTIIGDSAKVLTDPPSTTLRQGRLPLMRIHLINPSDVSFGAAVYYAPLALRAGGGDAA